MKSSHTRTKIAPIILMSSGLILLIGVTLFYVLYLPKTSQSKSSKPVLPIIITRITLADAKQAYEEKTALFLDVRSSASYSYSHIPNSVNIPLIFLEERLGELDKNQWIIPYCT
jgi:hypothetical protein